MKNMLLTLFVIVASSVSALAIEPISSMAKHLDEVLDSMHVLEHWTPGVIVHWRTGDPTGKVTDTSDKTTHCSQFAAAACAKLGVYLLRPPKHPSKLLANAQYDWLAGDGRVKGWKAVTDGVAAQDMANKGHVVVAVLKNPDPMKHGHIALVRPGELTAKQIAKAGPQIIQAGGHNYERATLKQGFANHPGAFSKNEIRFYSHELPQ